MKSIDQKEIERVFSSQVRLKIIAALVVKSPLLFSNLIDDLELTKGNLSSHMKNLEDIQFIEINKQFIDKRPQTSYTVTEIGKNSFKRYIEELEKIISLASKIV